MDWEFNELSDTYAWAPSGTSWKPADDIYIGDPPGSVETITWDPAGGPVPISIPPLQIENTPTIRDLLNQILQRLDAIERQLKDNV